MTHSIAVLLRVGSNLRGQRHACVVSPTCIAAFGVACWQRPLGMCTYRSAVRGAQDICTEFLFSAA